MLFLGGTAEKLDVDKWYHLMIIGDGTNATIYQDGTKRSTRPLSISALDFTDFYVGTPTGASANCFMDDIMFYPKMLTYQEVTDLYNSQKINDPLVNKVLDSMKSIVYYPNPVKKNENLQIDLSVFHSSEPINFSVISVDGKTIYTKVISELEQKNFSYKVTQEGVFFIMLNNKKQKETFKVIVN